MPSEHRQQETAIEELTNRFLMGEPGERAAPLPARPAAGEADGARYRTDLKPRKPTRRILLHVAGPWVT